MPIKLNDSNKSVHQRFKRGDVREMVHYHRKNNPLKKLNFAHFALIEVLELLRDNGVLDFTKPVNAQLTDLERFGIKLYPGIHSKPETCPGKPEYLKHSNIIICTTEKDSNNQYIDMLTDQKDSISMAGFADALDLAQICPPECGNTDDVGV